MNTDSEPESSAVRKRLGPDGIEALARRVAAGEAVPPRELQAVCDMARELLEIAPSLELVRLALMLVSSRGALPLKSAQAEALGATVLKAAQPALVETACRALQEMHAALSLGANWIEGLERLPRGNRIGPQLPRLARSMTKTMVQHVTRAAEALSFGMPGKSEPLESGEPGYKDIPPFDGIAARPATSELERAHDALRVGRLGVVKFARFTHALSQVPETRIWDDDLVGSAAQCARDTAAHMAAISQFLGVEDRTR